MENTENTKEPTVEELKVTVNRLQLKIRALLERISSITTQYENEAAEMRVEYTELVETAKGLEKALEDANDISEESEEA